MPCGDAPLQHRLGALVQAPQQCAKGGGDDEGHQERAHAGAFDGSDEGVACRFIKPLGFKLLLAITLHRGNGVEHLGSDSARIGHPVLAGAAEFAHAFAEKDRRQHHQHQNAQHLGHHIGVGENQHAHGTHAHHGIAQTHGETGAHHGLNERGVGGQARQHFAGLCAFKKLRTLTQHMGIHRIAQIGGDALAQPAHHVKPGGGKHTQGRTHRKERQEMFA